MRALSFSLLFLVACGGAETPAPTEAPAAEAPAAEAPAAPAADATAAATTGDWKHFGAPFTVTEKVSGAEFFANPDAYLGKTVRIESQVADVCQKKGCWMVVSDGTKTMRVMMKDHAFGVDMDSTGSLADLEGVVSKKAADPEKAAHFKSEAKNPEVVPAGEGVTDTYEIEVTGVALKKQSA